MGTLHRTPPPHQLPLRGPGGGVWKFVSGSGRACTFMGFCSWKAPSSVRGARSWFVLKFPAQRPGWGLGEQSMGRGLRAGSGAHRSAQARGAKADASATSHPGICRERAPPSCHPWAPSDPPCCHCSLTEITLSSQRPRSIRQMAPRSHSRVSGLCRGRGVGHYSEGPGGA